MYVCLCLYISVISFWQASIAQTVHMKRQREDLYEAFGLPHAHCMNGKRCRLIAFLPAHCVELESKQLVDNYMVEFIDSKLQYCINPANLRPV